MLQHRMPPKMKSQSLKCCGESQEGSNKMINVSDQGTTALKELQLTSQPGGDSQSPLSTNSKPQARWYHWHPTDSQERESPGTARDGEDKEIKECRERPHPRAGTPREQGDSSVSVKRYVPTLVTDKCKSPAQTGVGSSEKVPLLQKELPLWGHHRSKSNYYQCHTHTNTPTRAQHHVEFVVLIITATP